MWIVSHYDCGDYQLPSKETKTSMPAEPTVDLTDNPLREQIWKFLLPDGDKAFLDGSFKGSQKAEEGSRTKETGYLPTAVTFGNNSCVGA